MRYQILYKRKKRREEDASVYKILFTYLKNILNKLWRD